MQTIYKINANNSNIDATQLINNHNCMVFNKLHIANIDRFIPITKQVEYNGMNYTTKQEKLIK